MLQALLILFACLVLYSGGSDVVLGIVGKSAFIECQLPVSNTLVWQTGDGNIIAINGQVTNENSTKYVVERQNGFRESLVIHQLTLADDKLFRCFDLKNSSFADTTKLNILALPAVLNVTVTPQQPMLEGTEVTLTCGADGGKPLPDIKWFIKYSNGSTTETNGNITDIMYTNGTGLRTNTLTTNVTRDMFLSTIICNISVPLLYQESLPLHTDVLLAPLQPEIASPGYNGSYDENSVVKLHCLSEGSRPTPIIYWLLNGNRVGDVEVEVQPQNETFTIKSNLSKIMSRDYNGSVLTCAVTNKVLQDQGLPARMTNITLLASFKPNATIEQKEYTRSVGDNVTLRCHIDANPLPNFEHLYWTHKGAMIDRKYYSLSNGSDVFNLTLQNLKISDAGNYSCHAVNRLGASTSEQTKLTVLYAPVCESGSVQKLAVRQGEQARLKCTMFASPNDVMFTWRYKQTEERIQRLKGTVDNHNTDLVYSTLELTMGTKLRYADIECYGSNTEGMTYSPCQYKIVPPGPPESPSNCSTSAEDSQVNIRCQPGFNGGSLQHFILQKLGSYEFESLLTSDTPDFVFHTYENVTVRMCAFNDDFNNMKVCSVPTAITVDVPVPPQSDPVRGENSHKAAYIAGGVIASVGVITIAVIIALLLFRRYNKEKSTRNINDLESGSTNQAVKTNKLRAWWKYVSLKRLAVPFRKTGTDEAVAGDIQHCEVITDIDDNDVPNQDIRRLASTPYRPLKTYRIDRKASRSVFNIGDAQTTDKEATPDVLNESTGFALSPIISRNFKESSRFHANCHVKSLGEIFDTNSINEITDVGVSNCYNTEDMLDVLCETDARDLSRDIDKETLANTCVKTLNKEYTDGDIDDVLGSFEGDTNQEKTDASGEYGLICEENTAVCTVDETDDFSNPDTILKFMNVDFSDFSTEGDAVSKLNNINEESFDGNAEEFYRIFGGSSVLLRSPITKSPTFLANCKDLRLSKSNSLPYRIRKQRQRNMKKVYSLSDMRDCHKEFVTSPNRISDGNVQNWNQSLHSCSSDKNSSECENNILSIDTKQATTDSSVNNAHTTDAICDIDEFTLTINSDATIDFDGEREIDCSLTDTLETFDYSSPDGMSTMGTDFSETPLDIDAFTLTITSEGGEESEDTVEVSEKVDHLLSETDVTSGNEQVLNSTRESDRVSVSPRKDLLRRNSFLEAINNAVTESDLENARSPKIGSDTEGSYFNYGYEKDSDSKSKINCQREQNDNDDCVNVVVYF